MAYTKKGQMGESIVMIYHLLLIGLVALTLVGISQWKYQYHIDIKHSEAKILSRGIATCLFKEGTLHVDKLSETEREAILQYCGYGGNNLERIYVTVTFTETGTEKELFVLSEGDSGRGWIKKLFDVVNPTKQQATYVPGKITDTYSVTTMHEGEKKEGTTKIMVTIHNE